MTHFELSGIKSRHSFGDIAQTVEQAAHIRCVEGSSPPVAIPTSRPVGRFFFVQIKYVCSLFGVIMSVTEWEETVYRETFDKAKNALEKRRQAEPDFNVETLKGILEHLYIQDGLDQYGRGRLQDLVLQATLDAHEAVLADMQKIL